MNEFTSVPARQIDRLVDGELSQAERRAILMALDHEEGGWRRVALAFLESQALRDGLARKPIPRDPSRREESPSVTAVRFSRPVQGRWRAISAVVACSLLMFGLGRFSIRSQVVRPVESSSPATYSSTETTSDDPQDEIMVAESTLPEVQRQQTLRLELGDSAEVSQAVEVPVVEGVSLDPDALWNAPPVISDSLQRDLLRSGRRVYEQRQLFEVTLDDGRSGIVPISEVFVENVGWNVYQ
ncbi:MAG: hypothetical protein JSS49_00820 [Planctomycetes bacterium]|nr:hypothetical protein [Planctomycetota bacterium]